MKTLKYSSLLLLTMVLSLLSCGGSDDGPGEPTAQEMAFELLAGSWTLNNGSIVLDGSNVSANFPGFSLFFANGTYSTSNAGDLFNASGTWSWVGDSDRLVLLDDGKEVNINTLTTSQFIFSFQLGDGSSVAGLEGNYQVTLTK